MPNSFFRAHIDSMIKKGSSQYPKCRTDLSVQAQHGVTIVSIIMCVLLIMLFIGGVVLFILFFLISTSSVMKVGNPFCSSWIYQLQSERSGCSPQTNEPFSQLDLICVFLTKQEIERGHPVV